MNDTYNDGYKTEDIKCIIVDFIAEDGKGGFPIMRQGTYVLCKDCIYWREQGYCSRFDFQNMCPVAKEGAMHMPMDADDFCSRGERK